MRKGGGWGLFNKRGAGGTEETKQGEEGSPTQGKIMESPTKAEFNGRMDRPGKGSYWLKEARNSR